MSKTAEYLMDQIERAIDCLANNSDLLDSEHLVKLHDILDSSKAQSRPAFMLANDPTFYDFDTGAELQPDYAGLVIIDSALFKTWIESGERNWLCLKA